MRVVFMGTPEFAVPSLEKLLQSRHAVVAAVSQPDKPAGRGLILQPTPVKARAQQAGIPVLQPEKIRTPEFEAQLAKFQPEILAVAAYGKILPENLLRLPRFGAVNVHASLLPRYRGAAPIQWALINGERKTGVTIMQLERELDSGPIISRQEIDILDDDDAISLSHLLSVLGAERLVETLDRIEVEGCVSATPQDHSQATFAPLIKKADGRIDWTKNPDAIICRIIALKPWPCAWMLLKRDGDGNPPRHDDEPWKIKKAISFYPEETGAWLNDNQRPGEVIGVFPDQGPIIRTRESCICLTEIQPPNRKSMSGKDALNGGHVKVGMIFG